MSLFYCLILLFSIYIFNLQAAKSPPPSTIIDDTIYLIWNQDKLTWPEALKFCEFKKLKLVSFETKEKLDKFNAYLKKEGFVDKPEIGNQHIFWTSGNDRKNKGKFVWESTGQKFSFDNWLPGQPDNWRKDEHCVEMGFREIGKWNDNRCWYHRNFICERKV